MNFENSLNPNLTDYLKQYAWDDDITSANAVYVVLDNEMGKDIVMYFALKNGSRTFAILYQSCI